MDPTQMKKIHAMNRHKRRQFVDNLCFYSLAALTCSVFCCVTLCLPYLSSLVNISGLIPFLLSSKLLFIIGNIIIFVLIVNSKVLSSSNYKSPSTTDVYYDEYIHSCQTIKQPHHIHIHSAPPLVIKYDELEEHNVEEKVEGGMNNTLEFKKGTEAWPIVSKEEENLDVDEQSLVSSSCSDDLNKRAEDFIARVNRQRKLELSLLHQCNY